MAQGIILVCLILIVVTAIASAMFHSQLKSAIALAATSALLAIVMFLAGATWAGLFELSVCAGLVTVVFVSTISMTKTDRHEPEKVEGHHRRFAALPFILIFVGAAFVAILLTSNFELLTMSQNVAATAGSFKEVFWNTRQADILGQIVIILAGAFAVVILFKESDKA